jgi:hypothetical protein
MRFSFNSVTPGYWYAGGNNINSDMLAYQYALRTGTHYVLVRTAYWYAVDTHISTLIENVTFIELPTTATGTLEGIT